MNRPISHIGEGWEWPEGVRVGYAIFTPEAKNGLGHSYPGVRMKGE